MKKLLIAFFALLGITTVFALVLPFVVDMNRFKPMIQTVVAEHVNAELEFESARLTILTGLGVELKGVEIKNRDDTFLGNTLFKVDRLRFYADVLPLLKQQFVGYIYIDSPEINLVRQGVRNNIAALTEGKQASEDPAPVQDEQKAAVPEPTPEQRQQTSDLVEKFKGNVKIQALEIKNATFQIKELGAEKASIQISELNLLVEDIGLEQDIKTKLTTSIDLSQDGIRIGGPISVNILTRIHTQGTEFRAANFEGKLSYDDLSINVRDAFIKKPGVPLHLSFQGIFEPHRFQLKEFNFRLQELLVNGLADIKDFKKLDSYAELSIQQNELESLASLLPQHAEMLPGGRILLEAKLRGLISDLARLTLNTRLDTKIGDSDLVAQLKVNNAKAPIGSLSLNSARLDLDALIGPFLGKASAKEGQKSPAKDQSIAQKDNAQNPPGPSESEPAKDFALSPKQKELIKDADFNMLINMMSITFAPYDIKNLVLDFKQRGLRSELAQLSLELFDGLVSTRSLVNLNPEPIQFSGQFDMKGIQTKELIAVIAPEHQETLQGKANFNLNLAGVGTTLPTLSQTLNGKGDFRFIDGQINSESVSEAIGKQLGSFISNLSVVKAGEDVIGKVSKILSSPLLSKLPEVQKFNPQALEQKYASLQNINVQDRFKTSQSLKDVGGSIEIKDGKVHFSAVTKTPAGDLVTTGSVGIDAQVEGTSTLRSSDDFKNTLIKQSPYAKLLFDQNNNLHLAAKISGPPAALSPTVDFSSLSNSFQGNAKALLEKEVQQELEKLQQKALGGSSLKALDDKRKAFQAKQEAEVKRQQEQAQQRVEEEKKKAEEEAKKKIQDKLKGKLPKF